MIVEAIRRLMDGSDLDENTMEAAIESIVSGDATPVQAAALLVALRMKGEAVSEVVGAVKALRRCMRRVAWEGMLVDTCGTGGDGASTFNISTASAIVAAAAGAVIAKHGNRAMSGRVGGADVLEELGVKIDLYPESVKQCLKVVGLAFLYAPSYHPAFRVLAGVRREIGVRTIANLLGPLLNPAGARAQLLGVFDGRWTSPLAEALGRLGSVRALVVHGLDGLDEITIGDETLVSELKGGEVTSYRISPEQFGLTRSSRQSLAVNSVAESASIIKEVLAGAKGPRRDVVVLNAAAAIWLSGSVPGLREGIGKAQEAIDSGAARAKLEQLVRVSTEARVQ